MSEPKRILIIEDDSRVAGYLSRLLKMLGYHADVCDNGADGLQKAQDDSYELIISDLNMPGEISQMDLIRRLREVRPKCPLVVISGYPSQERLDSCRELGVTEFLTKPFEVSFIKNILDNMFKNNEAADPAEGIMSEGAT